MMKKDIGSLPGSVGQSVTVAGWVHARRNMGKIVFIDLRDQSGIIQVVLSPDIKNGAELLKELRPEFVIRVIGQVTKRRGAGDPGVLAGLEVQAEELTVLNSAATPPFEIVNEDRQANEELRLQYRFLDLRHSRMQKNLKIRHVVIRFMREYLSGRGFLEVETPYLTKGTPEGAREYIVPSRQFPGQFYTLPQSPQQFKQLLMVAGVEKYFQIVRCFRDEDTRGDRQPEFTQLDLEMSFVTQEDILQLVEDMFVAMVKEVCPEKHITQVPFPRIPYAEATAKWKSDKPDIRRNRHNPDELGFCFIVDFPLFEYSETEKKIVPVHHLFTAPKDEDVQLLDTDPAKAKSKQHDFVLNGFEIAGGSVRIHDAEVQKKIFNILKLPDEEVERRFGHMLKAFSYGAPPHGGIAPGLDRIIMILANEPNIREVIAFPKTSDGRDLMMGAPSELPAAQLREANIRVVKRRR